MSNGYSRTDFTESCEENKAYLYIINCFNDDENFFKIGITRHLDLKKRFIGESNSVMPYKYKIIKQVQSFPSTIYDLETKLHQLCSQYEYNPLISFGGEFECFTDVQEAIIFVDEIISWLSNIVDVQPVIKKPKKYVKSVTKLVREWEALEQDWFENRNDEELCLLVETRKEFFLIENPSFNEWLDSGISTATMKTLGLNRIKIDTAATESRTIKVNNEAISHYVEINIGQSYTTEELKQKVQQFYDDLNISKKAKGSDIKQWYDIKATTILNNSKHHSGYKILGPK